MSCGSRPIRYTTAEKWHYLDEDGEVRRFNNAKTRCATLFGTNGARWIAKGELASEDDDLALALCDANTRTDAIVNRVRTIAERALGRPDRLDDPWLSQLDWSESLPSAERSKKAAKSRPPKAPSVFWPKWYWDLAKPKKGSAPGTLDLTVRNQLSPLLLRLSWRGWPLFRSREHGWTFRVPHDATSDIRQKPLTFDHDDDATFRAQSEGEDDLSEPGPYVFYKMPHKDGEGANVGSPLGKTFMKFAQDGTLTSPGNEARDALDMNAQCSYWISARDRIMGQTVVWQNAARNLGFDTSCAKDDEKWGVILPQVITMGTVTRRAIEKTWLTASNAKASRVGSELKAMVRAPPGYALVGTDVDAGKLWISSLLGDAQFGIMARRLLAA
jgi:DNA polymerase gamma 1